MALLINPTNPTLMASTMREAQAAASTLGVALHILEAGTEREFDSVFARLAQLRASGLVIAVDSFFTSRREQLAQLALRHRVPAIYQSRDFAKAGGVMSYGGSLADGFRLVGLYTGSYSQRREARRSASPADHKNRVDHQFQGRKVPGPHGVTSATCPRRRGDRVGKLRSRIGTKRNYRSRVVTPGLEGNADYICSLRAFRP
jgi:hypothetical protein